MENTAIIPLQVPEEFRKQYFGMFYELSKEAFEAAQRDIGLKRYLTKKEAAAWIGVSFTYFQKIEAMGLPLIQIGGKTLVDREDITKFMNQYKQTINGYK